MPINTDLNIAPYFDDFDVEKQFYKILFKPAYAVQARELTQLQTILQNQVEQFGDNIYQEGSIIKGCNFTNLDGLQFVKLVDKTGFDVETFISGPSTEVINGVETPIDVVYELVGGVTSLKASVITATRGFETRPPDLNTFYINYLNTNETSSYKVFQPGESITINRYKYNGSTLYSTELGVETIDVTLQADPTGSSFGIQTSAGVIFQKGHFLFANDQTLVVSKYTNQPDNLSVGFIVTESLISSLQDNTLYDNANGSTNENAPGADRLKMIPTLAVLDTAEADVDSTFFTLVRYQNGSAVQLRDVTQFNSINEELAKRTYEESGNYIVDRFKIDIDRRGTDIKALVNSGIAYVKGYRVETSGKIDFTLDPVTETVVQENQATTIDYGGYLPITSLSGTIGDQYEAVTLQTAGSSTIGRAHIRNITPTRCYLFGVDMVGSNEFKNVRRIVGTSGVIEIASNPAVKDASRSAMIFDTGSKFIKTLSDISIPVRDKIAAVVSSNTIEITAAAGEDFALNQDDITVVDASNTYIPVLSVAKSLNNSVITINLDPAANADPAADVYLNKRIINTSSYTKASVSPYVKVTYNNNTSTYSLGFPDVYKIESIVANTVDYTDSFKLYNNQNDHFYDISYMEHIPGRPVPPNGTLTIKLSCYELGTATGKYFFTINSYPIDDTTEVLPAGKIRSYDLDTYTSASGQVYNLRNCLDFRPHADKDSAVDYSDTTPSAAGVVTTAVGDNQIDFSGTAYVIPALNSNATLDVESYKGRIDLISMDSYGLPSITQGTEDVLPIAPTVGKDELVVAEINIPGYPALSAEEASQSGKFDSAIRIKSKGTSNYTMRDIEKIEQRIEGLEYYISLNQLEQQSENLLILDENGLSRFKNGYIVDPMNDTGIANLDDPNYKAAIHFDKKILTPALKTFPLDLKYKSSTGASIFPTVGTAETATLGRNSNVKLIGQPYATNFRNCVSNFWKYNGSSNISPSHDMAHDTVRNPTPAVIDIAGVFQDMQEFLPITGVNWDGPIVDGGSSTRRVGNQMVTTTQRTQTGTEQRLSVNDSALNGVGDFVSNVSFQPFMRSRNIKIHTTGLRPNTRHYFFFDRKDVNANVAPGTTSATRARTVQKFGAYGAAVTTDSNGVLRAVFRIPAGQFYVGDRLLEIVDTDQYESIASASTSKSEIMYRAYNISVEKTALSTRVPEFSTIAGNTTTRNLAARVSATDIPQGDPLAQTFFIKRGMGQGSNSVYISKVDLYFKRKSTVNGITVTLREVVNGYPSGTILPFSKLHLQASEVNVSDDATAITEINFETPIRMDTEKEYAVVIMPDANDPNYLHFTSKVGGKDLTTGPTKGQSVVMDWGDGVLFTSTNNRAWKSYQDEDIKFAVYRHNFNSASGTVTLTNDDHEFITLSDWTGRFESREMIYKQIDTGYTVSMVQNTNILTQSGNDFNVDYAAGDYILVTASNNVDKEIFRVASIDSSTQITTDKPCPFNASNANGKPLVAGKLSHYNSYNRAEMHLAQSSATSAKKFVAGDTVYGFDSGTEATIGSIDNINLSYIQPHIPRALDSVSNVTASGNLTNPSNLVNPYTMPIRFGDNNHFTQNGVVVYSKSNNLVTPKPFDINLAMTNNANVTSTPLIDLELATLMAYAYKTTNTPATTSKYISKTIELAEDLDAEDLNLYLTGYRPNGTDIKVYIRPQHIQDSANFDTMPWIELELFEGASTYSSSSNLYDYREYRYKVADANKSASDILEYTSTTGKFEGYRKFAIKIELVAENIHNVPFVKDYRGIALT